MIPYPPLTLPPCIMLSRSEIIHFENISDAAKGIPSRWRQINHHIDALLLDA